MGYKVPTAARLLAAVALSSMALACVAADQSLGPAGASSPNGQTTTVASDAAPDSAALPIDATLSAVSATAPTADAAAAMKLCGVDPADGAIAGMALVPFGAEVRKYAPMVGTEPELKTDKPVWVIQLKGEIQGRVGVLVDPTCVVVDGIPTTYLTHGAIDNGVRWTPPPVKDPPVLSLPPLGP